MKANFTAFQLQRSPFCAPIHPKLRIEYLLKQLLYNPPDSTPRLRASVAVSCYNISNSQRTVHRLRRNLTGVRTFQNHTILHKSIILHPSCCNRLCGAHAHTYTPLSTSLAFGRLSSRGLSHGSPPGFVFEGVSEYSEELMARIDAPSLGLLHLEFFYQPVFDIPQVPQFIHRIQKVKPPIEAYVYFCCDAVSVFLFVSRGTSFLLQPPCAGIDRQLSSLEQIFAQCSSIFSRAVKLHLYWGGGAQVYQSDSVHVMVAMSPPI